MTEPHPHHPLALTDQARTLTNRAMEQFRTAVSENQPERPEIPNSLQLCNEDRIRQTLTELEAALAPWRGRAPEDLSSRELDELEGVISGHLLALDESRCLFDEPFLAFFIDQGYLQAARAFFLQVRLEDPNLSNPEIFQALRNVWIMNSLQLYFDLPLAVTPAVYAYSLLYPYTDNFLDDPAVSAAEKAAFNDLISRALDGQTDAREDAGQSTGAEGHSIDDPIEKRVDADALDGSDAKGQVLLPGQMPDQPITEKHENESQQRGGASLTMPADRLGEGGNQRRSYKHAGGKAHEIFFVILCPDPVPMDHEDPQTVHDHGTDGKTRHPEKFAVHPFSGPFAVRNGGYQYYTGLS